MKNVILLFFVILLLSCSSTTNNNNEKEVEKITISEKVESYVRDTQNLDSLLKIVKLEYNRSKDKDTLFVNRLYFALENPQRNFLTFDYWAKKEFYDSLMRKMFYFDSNKDSTIKQIQKYALNSVANLRNQNIKWYEEYGECPGGEDYHLLYFARDSSFLELIRKIVKENKFINCSKYVVDLYDINPKFLPDSIVVNIEKYRDTVKMNTAGLYRD